MMAFNASDRNENRNSVLGSKVCVTLCSAALLVVKAPQQEMVKSSWLCGWCCLLRVQLRHSLTVIVVQMFCLYLQWSPVTTCNIYKKKIYILFILSSGRIFTVVMPIPSKKSFRVLGAFLDPPGCRSAWEWLSHPSRTVVPNVGGGTPRDAQSYHRGAQQGYQTKPS